MDLYLAYIILVTIYSEVKCLDPTSNNLQRIDLKEEPQIQVFSGVHVEKLAAKVYTSHTFLHFNLPIPPTPRNLSQLHPFICHQDKINCLLLNNTRNQILQQWEYWQARELHTEFDIPGIKSKRSAPFSFIGSINNVLFGTATEDEIRETEGHINQVSHQIHQFQSRIEHHEQDLLRFVNANRAALNGSTQAIQMNMHTLEENEAKLRELTRDSSYNIAVITNRLISLMQYTTQQRNIQQLRLYCANNRLDPLLIEPLELKLELLILEAYLRQRNLTFIYKWKRVNHLNPYYNKPLVSCIFRRDGIEVLLKIPLKSISDNFEVYQFTPIPLAYQGATHILELPTSIVITNNKHIIPLDEHEATRCGLLTDGLCRLHTRATITSSVDKCIEFIIQGGNHEASTACQYTLSPNNQTQLTYINDTLVYITNPPPNGRIICYNTPDRSRTHYWTSAHFRDFGTKFATRLTLPCNCHIEGIHLAYQRVFKVPCGRQQIIQTHQVPLSAIQSDLEIPALTNSSDLFFNITNFNYTYKPIPTTYEWTNESDILHEFLPTVLTNLPILEYFSAFFQFVIFVFVLILAYYVWKLYTLFPLVMRMVKAEPSARILKEKCSFPYYLEVLINLLIVYIFIVATFYLVKLIRSTAWERFRRRYNMELPTIPPTPQPTAVHVRSPPPSSALHLSSWSETPISTLRRSKTSSIINPVLPATLHSHQRSTTAPVETPGPSQRYQNLEPLPVQPE